MSEELLAAFVEASDIVVPEELVNETIERMTQEVFHRKRYESMAQGSVLMPEDFEQLTEEIQNTARIQVKTQLVLEDIIKREAFEVTEEELEEETEALAERQQMTVEMVKGFLGEDMASLKEDILFGKAIDFIIAQG